MNHKKLKAIISAILLCAIFFSTGAIGFVYASNIDDATQSEAEEANNSIAQDNLVVDLKINNKQENDVSHFEVQNMFPGDYVHQMYNISVSCNKDVTVKFHANVKDNSKKLAEVLKVKIILKETGKTLYDGLIIDMPKSLNFKIKTTEAVTKNLKYDIVVYLDTSVGSEYMGCGLEVDFKWWVEEVENLDRPPTGDDFNLVMWATVMLVSAVSVVILVKIKKGDEECEAIEVPPKD